MMEAYSKKRFSLKDKEQVTSLSWNKSNNLICAGMDNGNLKIIKLKDSFNLHLDSFDNLSNESESELELDEDIISSHKSYIRNLRWNEEFDKLMSCCSEGVFVVWKQDDQKLLREEMVNEGGKTQIRHVTWSLHGGLLCILLQKGQVVLGDVLGNRLWGRNFQEKFKLASFDKADQLLLIVQDSPEAKIMVLETEMGDPVMHLELENESNSRLIILESSNRADDSCVLACLSNGVFFLVKDILSSKVKRFDRGLSEIQNAQWSSDGKMFALSARSIHLNKKTCLIVFSQQGNLLHMFPTSSMIRAMDFNESSSRLVISTEGYLSVMSIRQLDSVFLLKRSKVVVLLGTVKRERQLQLFRVEEDKTLRLFRSIKSNRVLLMKSNEIDSFLLLEQVKCFCNFVNLKG
jgi:WD40 repeat protein